MTVVVPPGFWEFIQYVTEMSQEEASPGRRASTKRTRSRATKGLILRSAPKRKRKVSAYQKEFGRQLKKLKKKHPRTPTSKLMKRAHAATKRVRRGRR